MLICSCATYCNNITLLYTEKVHFQLGKKFQLFSTQWNICYNSCRNNDAHGNYNFVLQTNYSQIKIFLLISLCYFFSVIARDLFHDKMK